MVGTGIEQAMEDIMRKFLILATLLSTTAVPTVAQEQPEELRRNLSSTVELPDDVAARVEELRAHGDRFATAIRLIEQEAMKPTWGWDGCEHSGEVMYAQLPES